MKKRNNITSGSRIDFKVVPGYSASCISMEEGYNINISTPSSSPWQSKTNLTSTRSRCFYVTRTSTSKWILMIIKEDLQ